MSNKYTYESPDNGKTVYRRVFGHCEKEVQVGVSWFSFRVDLRRLPCAHLFDEVAFEEAQPVLAADLLAAQRQVSTKCTIYRTRELNSQLSTCVRVRSASLVLEIYHFESTFQSLFH